MANIFKNPLVLAETVVGSIIDQRNVVLWEQPAVDIEQLASSLNVTVAELDPNKILEEMIAANQLTELFTGFGMGELSKINGHNAYGISYISASVNQTSDLCTHPVESGGVITDNAIINPLKVTVNIAMPTFYYTRIYDNMLAYYTGKRKIMVQTKFGFYKNLVLVSMPHTLDNKDVDRVPIKLELQEVIEINPTKIYDETILANNARNPEDSDTRNLGQQKPTENTYESLQAIGLIK